MLKSTESQRVGHDQVTELNTTVIQFKKKNERSLCIECEVIFLKFLLQNMDSVCSGLLSLGSVNILGLVSPWLSRAW